MLHEFLEFFEVQSKPRATDAGDTTEAAMGEAFGEETVDEGFGVGGNAMPGMFESELVPTRAAEVALLAGVGVAVFDDGNGGAAGARRGVHTPLNARHALKATI